MPLLPAEAFNIAIWDDSNATHVGFDISSLYGRYFICSKQQWGTFPYNSNRWTYPITFNSIFVALKTTISDNTSEAGYPAWYSWSSDVTNTYAPHISSYQGYAIALGMQQWGLYLNTKTDRIHVPFNIPGTTFFNGLACYTDVSGGADIGIDVTLSNGQEIVVIIDSNKIVNFNFLWLAILKQQWGYGDALKWPGLTIELPIPFSNSVYATVAMGCPTTYFWDYPAQIKLNGLTEISYGVQQGVSEDKMFWLIIGQQQHKVCRHNLCRLCLDQYRQ